MAADSVGVEPYTLGEVLNGERTWGTAEGFPDSHPARVREDPVFAGVDACHGGSSG